MPNVFLDLPTTAGNGAGTAVDVSSMGSLKTVTVAQTAGEFQPQITIEFSNEAVPTVWTPLKTFGQAGQQTFLVACQWMRASTSNYRGGGAVNCDVASDDSGTSRFSLPVLASNGTAAAIDVSSLLNLKTIQVGSQFRGAVNIELSADGSSYETVASFKNPGQATLAFAAQYMRVSRSGVPDVAPGLPIVNVAGASLSGGSPIGPGTTNMVAKFTSSNTIGDSSIFDDGSVVAVNADLGALGDFSVDGLTHMVGAVTADSDVSVGGQLDVIGDVEAPNGLARFYQTQILGYFARVAAISPAALAAGTTNDYDLTATMPTASRIRQATNAANSALSGMVAPSVNGMEWILKNLGPGTLTLLNENLGSAAGNRFQLEGGVDRVIGVGGTVIISYDNASARWNCIG